MRDFLNIIILVGTIQGIITAVLLFRLKVNSLANTLLAWIILLISLACLNLYLLETVTTDSVALNILLVIVPLVVVMPIGPLVYFYVQGIINPSFQLNTIQRKHFYAAVLDFIPYVVAVIFISGRLLNWISLEESDTWDSFLADYNKYIDLPRWISLTIYLWITIKLLKQYNDQNNPVIKGWARQFTIGFMIFASIWFLHLVPYLIPFLSDILLKSVGWYPIYIPLIILVYWLGINGFIISFRNHERTVTSKEIPITVIEDTAQTLKSLMEKEQLFLNPLLKLSDVVLQTSIPQKTISAVLNQHIKKSFNEYVNDYRIEAFKKRLLENKDTSLTITGIAFECGFNSQATFQRVFKMHTKQSPSSFRNAHLKN